MSNYHIEGEIGEIKFDTCVSFTLIPNESFRHKEGEKDFALLVQDVQKDEKLESALVPIETFKSANFTFSNGCFNSQVSMLKLNRCTIRVHFKHDSNGEIKTEIDVTTIDYK